MCAINFFKNLKTDIFDVSTQPALTVSDFKNDNSKIVSIALRILGLMLIATSVPLIFTAMVSLCSLNPIIALGWIALAGITATLGHECIIVGQNKKARASNMLEGTWILNPVTRIFNRIQLAAVAK